MGLSLRHTLPASLLNFLAGLFAAAGISLLVTVETTVPSTAGCVSCPSTGEIAIDATAWIAASIFQAWAAHIADKVEKEVHDKVPSSIDQSLMEQARVDIGSPWARHFWTLMSLTAGCVILAIVLILVPNL
jgi:hypothetical protein